MTSSRLAFIREHAPCYLYDRSKIVGRCRELCSAIPQAQLLYSIKTNPFVPVVEAIAAQGFGADAASANEVLLAARAGVPAERIYYSAPGKTVQDLEKTMNCCTVIADSLAELGRLEALAASRDETLSVGVRVNPDFGMGSGSGSSSKFGIDEAQLIDSGLPFPHLRITGIHVHLRSQVLSTGTLCAYYRDCFALAERVSTLTDGLLQFINCGSGIGTVYDAAKEHPLELDEIGEMLQALLAHTTLSCKPQVILETGRFLVCNAGTYYTPVIDRKESHGRTYLIVRNALNGFLRPAVAEMLRQNIGAFPPNGQEPLYTEPNQCTFGIVGRTGSEETVDVAGNLCTALDVMAKGIRLPHAEPGDLLEVTNAGSYGCTLSPLLFSSQEAPGEYLWEE